MATACLVISPYSEKSLRKLFSLPRFGEYFCSAGIYSFYAEFKFTCCHFPHFFCVIYDQTVTLISAIFLQKSHVTSSSLLAGGILTATYIIFLYCFDHRVQSVINRNYTKRQNTYETRKALACENVGIYLFETSIQATTNYQSCLAVLAMQGYFISNMTLA